MGKLKTRKAAAKRFKVTGTGKFMRRQINRSHLLEHKGARFGLGLFYCLVPGFARPHPFSSFEIEQT
jgi:hypothetical protein